MGRIWNDEYSGYVIGRVELDGRVRKILKGDSFVGRVDEYGKVYKGWDNIIVGRVESNGNVYNAGDGGSLVGRVAGGKIFMVTGTTEYAIGRTEEVEGGAAMLLFKDALLNKADTTDKTHAAASSKEESGWLGWILATIALYFVFLLKSNWGGRIGIIVGVILSIIVCVTEGEDMANLIIMVPVMVLLLGTVGAIIGALIKFIIRMVNKNK